MRECEPLTREDIERGFKELMRPEMIVPCPKCHGEAARTMKWCSICQFTGQQMAVKDDEGDWVYRDFVRAGEGGKMYRVLVDQGGE